MVAGLAIEESFPSACTKNKSKVCMHMFCTFIPCHLSSALLGCLRGYHFPMIFSSYLNIIFSYCGRALSVHFHLVSPAWDGSRVGWRGTLCDLPCLCHPPPPGTSLTWMVILAWYFLCVGQGWRPEAERLRGHRFSGRMLSGEWDSHLMSNFFKFETLQTL